MSSRIDALRTELDTSRQFLNTVLDQVGDRWETQVYSDGLQWTVRDIVAHLVDADRGHNTQAMNIADGKDIIPEDFDIQRYNASRTKKNAETPPEQARAALQESRAELKEWLPTIDDAALDRKGRHASLRILSVEEILQWTAGHERLHANDIATALNIEVDA